jgi:hypothetical protein
VAVTSQQTQNQTKCIMKILHMELVRMFIIESFCGLDVSTHCFQHKASRQMKPRMWTRCYAVDRKCIHCISHMYDVVQHVCETTPSSSDVNERRNNNKMSMIFWSCKQAILPHVIGFKKPVKEATRSNGWWMMDPQFQKFPQAFGGGRWQRASDIIGARARNLIPFRIPAYPFCESDEGGISTSWICLIPLYQNRDARLNLAFCVVDINWDERTSYASKQNLRVTLHVAPTSIVKQSQDSPYRTPKISEEWGSI